MTVTTAVILLGHGSRDPLWSQPMQAMATAISAASPQLPVVCAYLELTLPTAEQASTELLARHPDLARIVLYPVFLGMGSHLREDLPALVESLQAKFPQVQIHITEALGMDGRLIQLVAQSVLQTCQRLDEAQS